MMTGEGFPSSRVIFLMPAIWVMRRPTAGDPVKVTLSTRGSDTIHSPTVLPGPTSRFMAPAGTPASIRISHNFTAVIGVGVAGLRATLLPGGRAGGTFGRPT